MHGPDVAGAVIQVESDGIEFTVSLSSFVEGLRSTAERRLSPAGSSDFARPLMPGAHESPVCLTLSHQTRDLK